jgi:uncharacterized protein YtpQ (UPF0354 family)
MKTALSISDILYERAEETASLLGIKRSKLFTIALEEFIAKYNGETITQKINEVYEKIDKKEFEPHLNVCLESLRNITKNDAW